MLWVNGKMKKSENVKKKMQKKDMQLFPNADSELNEIFYQMEQHFFRNLNNT
jgi:hypothetical protein